MKEEEGQGREEGTGTRLHQGGHLPQQRKMCGEREACAQVRGGKGVQKVRLPLSHLDAGRVGSQGMPNAEIPPFLLLLLPHVYVERSGERMPTWGEFPNVPVQTRGVGRNRIGMEKEKGKGKGERGEERVRGERMRNVHVRGKKGRGQRRGNGS